MRIFGIMLVRDAADLVRVNVLHHLSFGCERILAIDNGSTDRTPEVLARLAGRTPLSFRVDDGPYRQAELTTELAREAAAEGADWVLPIDVDELWTAPGTRLADVLSRAEAGGAGAVMVERTNLIQRRDQVRSTPRALLSMTWSVENPAEGQDAAARGHAGDVSVFECRPGPKILPRASAELSLARGGHDAAGLTGPVVDAPELHILHAALRSKRALARRQDHGRRATEVGIQGLEVWHARRWARELGAGRLEAEWAAHSARDGALDVDGRRVPLTEDTRLRDTVAPFVRGRAAQAAAKLLGRSF